MRVLCLLPLYCALLFSFALPAAGAIRDTRLRGPAAFGEVFSPFYSGFFEESFRASELREYVEDVYASANCTQPPDCDEPLPLVAYVFLDSPDTTRMYEKTLYKTFPAYLGYLALEKKDGRMQYAWTARAPGEGPHCLRYIKESSLQKDFVPSFFICSGEPLHCEFAPGATCASFFLWMKGHSLFFPAYRIFFTAGSPPDAAWTPEFDATETPDNRRILKNPLPGMRPAPWYPPDPKAEVLYKKPTQRKGASRGDSQRKGASRGDSAKK